jgi:hypothetical protein
MKRIANSIEILPEIKTDFQLDMNENPTEETYEYKEVLVKDDLGDVLETFRVGVDIETGEQFFNTTGVRLGISAWIS